MDEKEFRKKVIELLESIMENTKPPGVVKQVFEWAALIVGVAGILAIIEQIVKLFGG